MTVEEIFNSPAARYFRDALWNGEIRKIPVCNTCQCYDCRTNNREEIDRIVAWEAARLRGEKVFFWGAGQAYRQFVGFFDASQPIAMIIEGKNVPPVIDDIPTVAPEILLDPKFAKTPIVVFAWPETSSKILAKIKQKYPRPLNKKYLDSSSTLLMWLSWLRENDQSVFAMKLRKRSDGCRCRNPHSGGYSSRSARATSSQVWTSTAYSGCVPCFRAASMADAQEVTSPAV